MYRFSIQIDINRFNRFLDDYKLGYYMEDGRFGANSFYNTSGKLVVIPGNRYVISALDSISFFDSADKWLSYEVDKTNYIVKAPATASYMRICVLTEKWNSLEVNDIVYASPIYKDDLQKEYELESDQRFFRTKLTGKLTFINKDFEYINGKPFDTVFTVILEKLINGAWSEYFKGKFSKTDCNWDADDKSVSVSLNPLDQYNAVLAGLEKEYNLISLAPEIESLLIKKRPLIQVYIPGDSVVSCFLGGTTWEQNAEPIYNDKELVTKFYFAQCNALKEMKLSINGEPKAAEAIYVGKMIETQSGYTCSLTPSTPNGYRIQTDMTFVPGSGSHISISCYIIRTSDDQRMFSYLSRVGDYADWDDLDFTLNPEPGSGASGTASIQMKTYNIYARYLLDVDSIDDKQTYDIPVDDLVSFNRNYRKVIGYSIDIADISNAFSSTPTEWGRTSDGNYFHPPYSIYGQKYYPIARSSWIYASIWFSYYQADELLEKKGRKTYRLKDSFPVGSCISTLLKQFAPNIKHEMTPEYSQFLYSDRNPVSFDKFYLFVSQKSNILHGDYQTPAQKSSTSLKQFTNMLRDCFKCYWYIDGNKFKIEHVSFFRNGLSYSGTQGIEYDLTRLLNPRNRLHWSFASSKWSYDKIDMPDRYQFGWMDDCTEPFDGLPIEIKSKFVTEGKIEDISVDGFTPDVDMMLLSPEAFSKDGFALFSAIKVDALTINDSAEYPGRGGATGTNGFTSPNYPIKPECTGRKAVLSLAPSSPGIARLICVFYGKNGAVISTQGQILANNGLQTIRLDIPIGAAFLGYRVTGTVTVPTYKLEVEDMYEIPITTTQIGTVKYVLQNGDMAFMNLQPKYYIHDLPSSNVEINGSSIITKGVARGKKQDVSFPVGETDPNPMKLIRTDIGTGEIDKISINLQSRKAKVTLRYDTEQ